MSEEPCAAGLIMIAGSSPGAGKTRLMRALIEHYRRVNIEAHAVDEDDVWGSRVTDRSRADHSDALPAFRTLLDGGSAPTASDVLRTFDVVMGALPVESVCVQDWTWLDLGWHMSWAQSDRSSYVLFAEELRRRAAPRRPALLYLNVDTDLAVQRATDERGELWLAAHASTFTSVSDLDVSVEAVAAFYRRHEDERLRRLAVGGWEPVAIDGGQGADRVVADAVRALERSSRRDRS